MKKIIFIFFVFIIISGCIIVYSRDFSGDEEIREEIFPVRDNNDKFLGISCVLTIPEDFSDKEIKISPDIFGGINEYREMDVGSNLINLKVINNSKYNYTINLFNISTKDIIESNNYINTGGTGFDGKKIYDIFSPYRVVNSAIENLFKEDISDISNSNIEIKLKENGYKDIDELDKYYLDFYNNKYNLNCNKLSEFNDSIIKEIFLGENTNYLEKNIEIIELAYYYFYNYIFSFTIDEIDYKIGKSIDYSFDINKDTTKEFDNFKLNISDKYMTNAFDNYKYIGDISFKLNRS